MDYSYAKFGDCIFSHFGFIMRTTELECTHRMRTHAVLLLSVSPPSE